MENAYGKVQELWLHHLWIEKKLYLQPLQNSKNLPITIQHPGWYNRGWGPDFKDAKITIGEHTLFGDIEFHINESDWFQHRHHIDPRYNKVILHIYLLSSSHSAVNHLKQPIEKLCLLKNKHLPLEQFNQKEILISETPGACGLAILENKFKNMEQIIHQAAENRLIKKAEQIQPSLTGNLKEDENMLYTRICKALGYTAESTLFENISQLVPYQQIQTAFKTNFRQSRIEFLAIWFQLAGVLEKVSPNTVHDEIRREMLAISQRASQFNHTDKISRGDKKYPTRPYNKIFRRIIGLYYHLSNIQHDGLLKSWLKLIYQMAELITTQSRAKTMRLLDSIFPSPEWDPFSRLLSLNLASSRSPSRFIGQSRQLIILINAIIPFFLAWSRQQKNIELEKKIFAIYLSLPSEGENQKTRFMKKRLQAGDSLHFRNILPQTQGLIQIYDDCCSNFYEGCENCSFLKILNSRLDNFSNFN